MSDIYKVLTKGYEQLVAWCSSGKGYKTLEWADLG